MKSLFVSRVRIWHEEAAHDTLVIFNAAAELDDLALSTELREDLEENLEPQDILVIVNDAHFADAYASLNSSSFVAQSVDRFRRGVRMSLVAFNGLGAEVRRCPLIKGMADSQVPLEAVSRPCMTRIFQERQGFVESSPNYHFENPSGKHTLRFIRLSNLISKHAEISFMAFCVLRAIPAECRFVYTDTPSVFPLMAGVNEHRRPTAALSTFIPTENFSSYSVLEDQTQLSSSDSVVLISASSSGSLANDIHNVLGYPRSQIWHVLFNGANESDHQTICDLQYDKKENPEGIRTISPDYKAGACAYCASGSFPIPLQGDQFELPGPQLDSVQLNQPDEPAGLRSIIARYAGKKVFGVGMGARQSGFARQYNIDATILSSIPDFMEVFKYNLSRSLPYSCEHIVYLDKPSLPLAEDAQRALASVGDTVPSLFSRDQLDAIPTGASAPVVVIAAAVESGRSLLDLSRDLRSICTKAPIVYIIGISKTNGSPRREELDTNLAVTDRPARHQVVTCERIILPVSSEGHAWHREREMLARMRSLGRVDDPLLEFVDRRLAALRNETTVLLDDLFWTNAGNVSLKVQPGFVYATRSSVDRYAQADVYFTISSVLQRLRAAGAIGATQRGIKSNWFQQTLLSPGNFGRFNDGVIQASLLRAASPRELNYSGDEDLSREAGRIIARIIASAAETRGEGAAEFLLAIATKSLHLRSTDLELVLSSIPPDLPRLQLLKGACELFAASRPT